MLLQINSGNYNLYIEKAYELSQNISFSAFPLFCDGIKTKRDFNRWVLESFDRDNESIIVLLNDNSDLIGWFHYFINDNQIGLCTLFFDNTDFTVLNDLFQFLFDSSPNHLFNFYIPHQNQKLLNFCLSHGFSCIDEQFVDIFDLKLYQNIRFSDEIIKIDYHNFDLIAEYYNETNISSYLSINELKQRLNDWSFFGFYSNNRLLGFIGYKLGSSLSEIFILETNNDLNNIVTESLINAVLSDCSNINSEYLYFFSDVKEHAVNMNLGFNNLSKAICVSNEQKI
ncbi:hypothetical protein [Macrococcus sp. DPC7161]|uniref:hypothetical protein n=1 Tax=Macrococcus sp. DPC7161 TaxID=2507060 RepID=UPI00100C0374|nr:hypothetical protein [Macrococcus sp. DPC7161]RXK19189.1 hypothetical protein ER639_02410 [Macrococcus sp. DPC7161]